MLGKLGAELLGTALFVFFGCGAAVLLGGQIGPVGVALGFGLAYGAAMWITGPVSGGHLNPAVSLGMVLAGRIRFRKFLGYAVAQGLGALLGAWVLAGILAGTPEGAAAAGSLAHNGFGPGFGAEYTRNAALGFEIVASLAFVALWMRSVQGDHPGPLACVVAGGGLALLGIFGAEITGLAANPALALGPALISGETAGLWLFLAGPLIGGLLAGLAFALRLLRTP